MNTTNKEADLAFEGYFLGYDNETCNSCKNLAFSKERSRGGSPMSAHCALEGDIDKALKSKKCDHCIRTIPASILKGELGDSWTI